MNAIVLHPFRAWTLAVFLVSSVGQSVLAQVNDDFADRIVLDGILPVSITGSNVGATAEHGERDYGVSSVWWEWTAPSSGTVQINTFGSDFSTGLAVYAGMDLVTLSEIASNNQAFDSKQSRVRFSAVIGTTYQIAVDGFGYAEEGNIELTISVALPGPPNDHFADRIVLPSVVPISTVGSNVNASVELDEPDHGGNSAGRSVWWEWTAPSSGIVQIDTFGSDFDMELAVYAGMDLATLSEIASDNYDFWDDGEDDQRRVRFAAVMGTTYHIAVAGYRDREGNIELTISQAPPGPPNDNFEDRTILPSESSTSTVGSNVNASVELDEPDHAGLSLRSSVWWSWTAPSKGVAEITTLADFDTALAVYTGTDLAALREIVSNEHADGDDSNRVRFSAVMGTTYHIAVDGLEGGEGNIALTVSAAPGPPNDNFEDRIALPSALPTSAGGSNVNASVELDEPDHAGDSAGRSVWWEWTAPSSGTVQIDTIDTQGFVTVLAVYTGMDLATLNEIASDHHSGGEGQSRVRFSAVMGTTYQIVVDSYHSGSDDGEGNIALNVSMAPPGPPNDNFEDRIALPSEWPTSTGGSNEDASVEHDEPDHAGGNAESSVWWEWTAPSSGLVEIETFDGRFDTVVYTGLTLGTLREIARNYLLQVPRAIGYISLVRFVAEMGTTYQIAVDGDSGYEGYIEFRISMAPSVPPNDDFADRTVLPSESSISTNGSNVLATDEHDEPDHAGYTPKSSVWWEWTAPYSGTAYIGVDGRDFERVLAVYTGMDLATLREVASDGQVGYRHSSVRFSAVTGTTYQIACDVELPGHEEDMNLTIRMVSPGPPNDNFEDRIALPNELSISAVGSNVNASVEQDEPAHAGTSTERTVWWEWTAPSSELVRIDTAGSGFVTELAVYTGMALATLTEVASYGFDSYDYAELDERHVDFLAVMGTTYQIAIDGYAPYNEPHDLEGNIALNISMASPGPPNDNFEDRVALPSELPTSAEGDNVHATAELDEPYHGEESPVSSVWWTWTAPSSGTVVINTFGSDFDMILTVYSGMELATLNWISDNYVEQDHVRFSAVSGTTYQIAVDSFEEAEGAISLQLETGFSPSAAR